MWAKIKSFFSNFFGNVKADPMSSLKGAAQLAAAGATCYGMATGVVPMAPTAIGTAAAFTASGIHALGTNTTTGIESPEAVKAEAAVQTAASLAPVGLSVVDQIAAMKKDADDGQQKIDQFAAVTSALATVMPPAKATEGQ